MNLSSKIKIFSTALCLSFFYSTSASADFFCDVVDPFTEPHVGTLKFDGPVIVQRDVPKGTILATSYTGAWANGVNLFGCVFSWTYKWNMLAPFNIIGDRGVYTTNIEGIGIRLTDTTTGRGLMPYSISMKGNTSAQITGDGIKGELVKLTSGPIGNEVIITSGNMAEALANTVNVGYVVLDSVKIIPIKCDIKNKSVDVPLGDITVDKFTAKRSSLVSKIFDIGLSCDKDAKVNVTLSAGAGTNTDIGGRSDIFNLTGYGGEDVADGVGVQILYENNPLENNQRLALKKSAGGNETFEFTARYYQTKPTVKAGKADATATLVISYQ